MMARIPDVMRQPPSEELRRAFWLLGDWETSGHVYAQGSQPEFDGRHSSIIRCSLTLNGHALKFTAQGGEEQSDMVGYLYVDPYDGAWVDIEFEPNVAHHVGRTAGWNGDVLEFEGPVRIFDDVAVWRHRLVRVSDDEWRWENDEQLPDGTWRKIDYHWYRRVPGT
jgi:hypothetical protein